MCDPKHQFSVNNLNFLNRSNNMHTIRFQKKSDIPISDSDKDFAVLWWPPKSKLSGVASQLGRGFKTLSCIRK